jgi:long-subunit fatty acid transport protein
MMTRPACRLALLLAFLAAWPAQLAAGGFHISILGARRTGMMTNLAAPDDVTALFHNPAGLADLDGTRLHLSSGFTLLESDFRLQALDPARFPEVNPWGAPVDRPTACGKDGKAACPWPITEDGYYASEISPTKYFGIIPYVGASQGLGSFSPRLEGLTVSLAAYAPGAYGAYLPEDAPTAYFVTHGLFVSAAVALGAGWRINKWLAVGANLSYNYLYLSYAQKFSTADLLTPNGEAPDITAKLAQAAVGDLNLDYTGRDDGMGWTLGVLVTPFEELALAMVYSGWTSARFNGPVSINSLGSALAPNPTAYNAADLRAKVGSLGYKLPYRLEVGMAIPPALMWGVNFRPAWWMEMGVDFRLWLYSLYKRQDMVPLYHQDEEGEEPLSADALSKDKHYGNSWEIAWGLLVRPLPFHRTLELMTGFGFDHSPVPDSTFSIDNPSMNQLLFTFGVRETIGKRLRLGLAYMMDTYLGRNVTNSVANPPVNVRVSGRSHIPTFELEYAF